MSYKLSKPYEDNQRLDFIVKYNHNLGLNIIEDETAIYALEPDEVFINGNIEKNLCYESEKRILDINIELQNIQLQLNALDLKTIRALREGGVDVSGTSFLEIYQKQIDKLRENYSNLQKEKTNLEKGEQDDITN